MKKISVLIVLLSLISLSGCLKEAAKGVGDVGNSGVKTVDDTIINRDGVKK